MSDLILKITILAPPVLLALTLHEFAHGYVAYRLGDPTAKALGRLTLNPIKHLDPLGTIVFFLINIGWAKPVPINASHFRNPQKDMLRVAAAGPLANLGLAIFSAIVAKLVLELGQILPYSPLASSILIPFFKMVQASIWINLVLCIFNLLPIPPLDGSKMLMGVLPYNMARTFASFERYGFLVVLVLATTGLLGKIIFPIIQFAHTILVF